MRLRLALILGLVALGGCDLAVPNGLFGCGQPTDCPSGYFCWNSDSRCYDAKQPECVPKTCEQVMADFASLGIAIECGSLPDGCEGSIECGGCAEGSVCGANGQNFICGCEENTCASIGAECGPVPMRCGGQEQAIFCGDCFGEFVCQDNRCICPPGANCDSGCDGGEPAYPCAQNDCSPPAGLPDGCGGVTHCPSCANGDSCVQSEDFLYECLDDCTCEAEGIKCGNASVCGSPTPCGTCAGNGFEGGYHCEAGRCVCEDPHEPNESSRDPAPICVRDLESNCMQDVGDVWGIDVPATLRGSQDLDFYSLDVLDAPTPIFAQADGGRSRRILYLAYRCPDTSDGIDKCSGWTISIDDTKFCVANGDSIGIERRCDSGASSETRT
ncbi:MAG: hypothetical protein JRD92_08005, partial [Deltaproteobacteria bacterium]|nr:hypothetical protein [Deltaproteobacteria bacterium]